MYYFRNITNAKNIYIYLSLKIFNYSIREREREREEYNFYAFLSQVRLI